MLSGAVPELVNVIVVGVELDPTGMLVAKFTLPGTNVTAGAGGGAATPVAVSAMDCEPPGPLSVITMEAVRVPAACGVKIGLKVQVAAGASETGQSSPGEKSNGSAPDMAMELISSGWWPEAARRARRYARC